ncbi:MAG: hypothetical protein ABW179_10510 [Methylobacterium sp.]
MSTSEIVKAYEAGLITEHEAAEQGLVDRVSDLYARLSSHTRLQATSTDRATVRAQR